MRDNHRGSLGEKLGLAVLRGLPVLILLITQIASLPYNRYSKSKYTDFLSYYLKYVY